MPKNPWSRYLLILAASTLGLCGAMAGLNYAADPYGIWHHGRTGDWTKSRPALRDVERLHKAHAVAETPAETLLLGNSRVVVGLDPRHPALPQPAYNLGISASSVYECGRYLQHAIHLHQPRLVLFAIDKIMFDATLQPKADFNDARLSVNAGGRPQPGWTRADVADTLFSLTAVADSLRTLAAARSRETVTYAGGLRDESLMKPYLKTAKIMAENERWKTSARNFALTDERGGNAQFDALRDALRLCSGNGIDVILFTNPIHAELLETEYGDGVDFSHWLRRVAAIVAEESAASGREIPFWNFYGCNAITTEPFPERNQPVSAMQNFWEISHYRKSVGDLVLSRLLGRDDPRLAANPTFGRRVTLKTVDQDLTLLAAEQARWKQTITTAATP